MTSFTAKSGDNESTTKRVVFVVYPNIVLLDLAGPLQVFAGARHSVGGDLAYQTAITSIDGGQVSTDTIIFVDTEPMSRWMCQPIHTLVVVGGNGAFDAIRDDSLVNSVAKLAARSERVCSVCSGALVLAATGILNGRRAVTHWEDCQQLAEKFPEVKVEVDPIFVKDGHVWTSAGITAGIDMALAIIADDLGRVAALDIARSLVAYMVRPGGQSQFSPALDRQKLDSSGRFRKLHEWVAGNLDLDLRVEQLAERANMSQRNFSRLYASTMGTTPAKAVETMRLEAAREMLETTNFGVKTIANHCGFGDDERMRRAFVRMLNVTPSEYRGRFQIE